MSRWSAFAWIGLWLADIGGTIVLAHGHGAMPWGGAVLLPLAVAALPGIMLISFTRAAARSRQRVAAAELRTSHLEVLQAASESMWAQQTLVDALTPAAVAAGTLAGGVSVTAYLPDPDEPSWLNRVLLVPPDAAAPAPAHLPLKLAGNGLKTTTEGWALLPLTCPGAAAGGLLVIAGVSAQLGDEQRRALDALAAQTANALRNARRHELALARASEDGLTGLLNHRAFQARLESEVTRAQRHGHALSVIMVDLDNFGEINNRFGHQIGDAALVAVATAIRQCARLLDVAARYGGDEFALILPESTVDEAHALAERIQSTLRAFTAAELGVPISIDASIGVAALPRHARTRNDLVRAADQAAYAAKHAGKGRIGRPEDVRLLVSGDTAAVAAQLEHANLATVEALAAAVDAKDPYTRGHAQRVSVYAAAVAATMDLSADDVAQVRLAGLLHDVGKIGVADAILTKAGPLSDDEFAQLQQHPVIGERVLSGVPFLQAIVPAIRHHHERWDGTGYPDGLAGMDIPWHAAIVMIADSFDAMTTSRTYRPALPLSEALRRIRDGRGTQFNPRVADAFERAHASGAIKPLSPGSTKRLDQQQLQAARASARLNVPAMEQDLRQHAG